MKVSGISGTPDEDYWSNWQGSNGIAKSAS